mmetsp:Transcript_18217/g.34683  ORF Transcript_18217/g.34683 Transcript_18217/m.34683 type:complete len:276 (-) Transcript_18217:527-1354(-)
MVAARHSRGERPGVGAGLGSGLLDARAHQLVGQEREGGGGRCLQQVGGETFEEAARPLPRHDLAQRVRHARVRRRRHRLAQRSAARESRDLEAFLDHVQRVDRRLGHAPGHQPARKLVRRAQRLLLGHAPHPLGHALHGVVGSELDSRVWEDLQEGGCEAGVETAPPAPHHDGGGRGRHGRARLGWSLRSHVGAHDVQRVRGQRRRRPGRRPRRHRARAPVPVAESRVLQRLFAPLQNGKLHGGVRHPEENRGQGAAPQTHQALLFEDCCHRAED